MATVVVMPKLGFTMTEGAIERWLKSEGDWVEKGEPLLLIITEKVTYEYEAPSSGILRVILHQEGEVIPVATPIAVLAGKGEELPDIEAIISKAPPEIKPQVASLSEEHHAETERVKGLILASPLSKSLAAKHGIDLTKIRGTGPRGRIVKEDVMKAVRERAEIPPSPPYVASAISGKRSPKVSTLARKEAERPQVPLEGIQDTGTRGQAMRADVLRAARQARAAAEEDSLFGKVIPTTKMRQVIARRMCESAFTAPHIHFFTDVNMDRLLNLREVILKDFEKRFSVRLSINDFLIRAVALAIREYPLLNATLKGEEIHVHPEINVGLAVALDEGLIVPAIPAADKLGLGAIAQTRADMVDRARKGKLTIEEVERGTFTVSSLATFDISSFTAILNPPQSGILTVGKTQDQLYVEGGEVKTRNVSRYGLSVDHRFIDGAEAAAFLQSLKKKLENPSYAFLQL